MYDSYIFREKLISPKTGYACRTLTKQNIRQFGYETIDDFLKEYPNFPLVCQDLSDLRANNARNQLKNEDHYWRICSKKQTQDKEQKEKEDYLTWIPRVCPKCGANISFENRLNAFCSRKCANARTMTQNIKNKISESVRKSRPPREEILYAHTCQYCNSIYFENKPKYSNIFSSCQSKRCQEMKRSDINRHNMPLLIEAGKKAARKQQRRSKQEKELYDLCEKHFSVSHNEPVANGWDADILLLDYKIAILWNGPWHYKEMNIGKHSLKQVINRDCIKTKEFLSIGWDVLIYEDRKWSPEEAFIDILLKTGVAGRGVAPLRTNL